MGEEANILQSFYCILKIIFSEIRDSKIGVLSQESHSKIIARHTTGDSRQVEKIPLGRFQFSVRTVRKNKLRWYATGGLANIFLSGEYGEYFFGWRI